MKNDLIQIHNAKTDKIVVRELTNEEQAIRNEEIAVSQAEELEQETAKAALESKKQEVLTKLGLTADEVTALLA
jgi:hypothetical protein